MRIPALSFLAALGACASGAPAQEPPPVLVPAIEGDPWVVARDPDLGPLTDPRQQPVDFGLWQAADGTWQIWSCIRSTKCGGKTRLFHRWEGKRITDPGWEPGGIALQADPALGETAGGLQAPFVLRTGGTFNFFYGDWVRICLATGGDGKTFARHRGRDGQPALFQEGDDHNARDPMVLRDGDRFICYYTAHPEKRGAVYARTSKDLLTWSGAKIVARGGAAGTGPYSAECPFVVYHGESKHYYLFRTQRYGKNAQTTVYRSPDPMDFGIDDDRFRVGTLPVAAPEIVGHEGKTYIAWLLPSLKGIQIARLAWVPKG